jgi:uncharacterized protein YjbI with pentapeptide repeats
VMWKMVNIMKKSIPIDNKMTKIINWKTNETIIEDENLTIRELIAWAVKDRISLAYADFTYQNLENVDFSGADLEGANFCAARLRDVKFCLCNLKSAKFKDADLSYSYLGGANFKHADFSGAVLIGAVIDKDQESDLLKALGVRCTMIEPYFNDPRSAYNCIYTI